MRTLRVVIAALVISVAGGACASKQPGHVDGGVLGRVVVYRNGVAFYERKARVTNGTLVVHVPRDRVDDFLKSLTVVDPVTRKPLSVTIPRREADDGSYLTMTLETADAKRADVLLTYVTEAPAWKPSYRVVVGKDGKVMLEGWAVVDNTTSEDWNGVLVGVGASSALAFRYDLWSVRQIDRDLLAGEERFAIAPPTGVSPYTEATAEELAQLGADEVRDDAVGVAFSGSTSLESRYETNGVAVPSITTGVTGVVTDKRTGEKLAGVTVIASSPKLPEPQTTIADENGQYALAVPPGTYMLTFYYADVTLERANVTVTAAKVTTIAQKLDLKRMAGETILISGTAPAINTSATTSGVTIDGGYARTPDTSRTFSSSVRGDFGGFAGRPPATGSSYDAEPARSPPPRPVKLGDDKLAAIVAKVKKDKRDVVIEVHGPSGSEAAAAKRGAAVKNKLVDDGVPATKIHVVPRLGPAETESVRVLAVTQPPAPTAPPTGTTRDLGPDTPVGESHFMADRPMTVRAGTSAMVAMVHGETTGGVVYLYDPISERGDQRFAFKAVRLDNPTDDTLEPGPVTVYGDGRFIGEGITEPVPPRASVVVPFALDKQIVISQHATEQDRIAKILTAQRGVLTAEVQHRREARFTVTSRLATPATVYLRHRLESGWTLVDAPSKFTKVGDSQLFELRLGPGETTYVTIAEATPVQRTFELGSPDGLAMMKVFIDEPQASPQLKTQIEAMLLTHRAGADLTDRIATLREQLGEYRTRSGELHAQIVTLKAVKTGGELMTALRAKLAETSDRIQKTTISLVEAQEQLMLARVKFQNQLADLRLTDATAKAVTRR